MLGHIQTFKLRLEPEQYQEDYSADHREGGD